ncbi:MAG: chemotaxis-specific protein-glutamate methyltransferase CheB [Planctomycetota bacterium]|jgi:two-component system chemotaxis response regulator CheB|nr:chemotaxis-specific protein-glutamate methyltransferase CheB [Planctomycetota bacterium]
MKGEAIRVLVVDDSAVTRRWLSDLIEGEDDLTVCGQAHHGVDAIEKVELLAPDVVTLDLDMPVLDGLSALEKIMDRRPTPVIIFSVYSTENAPQALEALERGAVDCVAKPSVLGGPGLECETKAILDGIRTASGAHPRTSSTPSRRQDLPVSFSGSRGTRKVVAIGASTGGPQAVGSVLGGLPGNLDAAVLIVQHLPDVFVDPFARRLDSLVSLPVSIPSDGDLLESARVYVAPMGHHLFLRSIEGRVRLRLDSNLRGRVLQPSVGELFSSLLEVDLEQVVSVLLTGMGDDGAAEMLQLKSRGACTLVQDESSCVVYGMPRVAEELGAVDHVMNLSDLAKKIVEKVGVS